MANDVRPYIYEWKDSKTSANPCMDYPPEGANNDTPLIIDNGSYQFRAGWGINSDPVLIFKNVIARNRGNKKDREWDVLIGNDIPDLEAVRWMIRTAFDFNVVVNFSVQESVFDHAFTHLGINTEGGVYHPVVLTEPLANLAYSRRQMSELLFEAYDIPRVSHPCFSLSTDFDSLFISLPLQGKLFSWEDYRMLFLMNKVEVEVVFKGVMVNYVHML